MARPDFPRTLAEFQSRFVTEDDLSPVPRRVPLAGWLPVSTMWSRRGVRVEYARTLSVQVLPASCIARTFLFISGSPPHTWSQPTRRGSRRFSFSDNSA